MLLICEPFIRFTWKPETATGIQKIPNRDCLSVTDQYAQLRQSVSALTMAEAWKV